MPRLPLFALLAAAPAFAQPVPARSFFTLPSSNGHGAIVVDASAAQVVHFRERLAATEEPLLDDRGNEVWSFGRAQVVTSRDLLYDAYFGVRVGGQQRWLSDLAVTSSGYAPGSGVAMLEQKHGGLSLMTYAFAPQRLPRPAFAMVLCARNDSGAALSGVSVFSLVNLHLGFGRPGVRSDIEANGETVVVSPSGDVLERGFAGVVATRPLGAARVSAWNASSPQSQNGYFIVRDTTGDLPAVQGDLGVANDWAWALQFDLGTVPAGAERCVGTVSAHHGDPFAGAEVQSWLDGYVSSATARALVDAELAHWAAFQNALLLPAGLSPVEAEVARQSAAVLAMAQVQERDAYLREWLTRDGERRYTRLRLPDGGAALSGRFPHRGKGAVLASLPPGEWTYAWVRDGAYAAVAMAELGLADRARAALEFFLDAEAGRYRGIKELEPYRLPPYRISLTRYQGFGVEESDFDDNGPNIELDGFGLTLWALREYERRTGDKALVDRRWTDIVDGVAEPLLAVIDPATSLVKPDSSIWETHWNGRQRTWAYTSITASRGLCDAAWLAERRGDVARATRYRQAAEAIRSAVARRLTDASGAIASNREELSAGSGYFDAAVVEGISMGLFAPEGRIAQATLDALDRQLRVAAGPGWARNDDRTDHAGSADLSPWGSPYDSAEWVVTDLRGAVALRAAGRTARADEVLGYTTRQASANARLIPETYDEATGAWKFNAPMVGFGAGAYVLALAQRASGAPEPACGAYFEAQPSPDAGTTNDAGTSSCDDGGAPPCGCPPDDKAPRPCGCTSAPALIGLAALVSAVLARRRSRRA